MKADMILKSDCIYDACEEHPFSGSIIIRGNKIESIEKTKDVSKWQDEKTEVIDLGNQTITPGFLDNHVFFTGYVWGKFGNNTEGAESQSLQMKKMFEDKEFMKHEYQEFSELLASRGVTAIKEIGFDDYSGFTECLKQMEEAGKLIHRINLVSQPVDAPIDYEYGMRCKEEMTGPFLRFMGYNIMVDGVISEHDGDMLDEYKDLPGVHCQMDISYKELEEMVVGADKRQLRCALHAEGDRAVRKTLDIYETCRKVNGERDSRHVITDLEMIRPDDVNRMQKLGVSASNYFQIMELTESREDLYVEEVCGEDKLDYIWAYRRMYDAGVNMCTGTDMPLDVPNIPNSLYYVHGRLFPDGSPEGGFQKEQGLTIAQVIKAWTIGGQYANFRENELGTLEKGKLADIAVFDRNIFTTPIEKIKDANIEMTICDGKIVYQFGGAK